MTKLMTKQAIIYRRKEAIKIYRLHNATYKWWHSTEVNKPSDEEYQRLIKDLNREWKLCLKETYNLKQH